jgi:ABC-2 type transport system permease protein
MKKELRHILRDPLTLALILALPAALLILLGYGITGDSKGVTMGVVDQSMTDASRRYIQRFVSSDDFKQTLTASNVEELKHAIDLDEIDVGLIIPHDFGEKIASGETTRVVILVDGSTTPTDATAAELKLTSISEMAAQSLLAEGLVKMGYASQIQIPIETTVQMLYNPNADTKLYLIPGLIPIILQVQTILLAALSIVREREQGTMEQLIVTPIKAWELMLGKIIPYLVVCSLNLFLMLWMGEKMFGIHVQGSYWDLIWLSIIFILGSLGMGVLISNIAKSQMQAVYIAVFIVIIPAIILTGLMFSRENMPAFTYWYSELLPVTHYLEITRGIIVRGVSAETLLQTSTIPLVALSIFYFFASVFSFRKHI